MLNRIVEMFKGIWHYIENLRLTVTDLNERVIKAQENIETIKKIILMWKGETMFKRLDSERKEPLLDLRGIFILISRGSVVLEDSMLNDFNEEWSLTKSIEKFSLKMARDKN